MCTLAQERTDQGQTRLVPGVDALHALRACRAPLRSPPSPHSATSPLRDRQLMHSLGFTPSVLASVRGAGRRHNQGRPRFAGPCAGPGHSARPSRRPLHLRLEKVPTPIQDMDSPGTLGKRYRQLIARGKTPTRSWCHRPGTAGVYVGDGPEVPLTPELRPLHAHNPLHEGCPVPGKRRRPG